MHTHIHLKLKQTRQFTNLETVKPAIPNFIHKS